ncbi:hypothetical protein [Streptomyces sp. CB02261]|uniref:hypothetical protein n=1 Tax=Streptomyces sp. CB02261 TaxID=1703940 RepID=UPI000939690F|nr:hypothetical protein [Streptomyces sp. CB02261]OKJ52553.1 hypothetical protein AMK29_30475 [Streptomyces sp. CB02261]
MNDYPSRHVPGAMAPIPSRTAPVPPLDDELASVLDDMVGIHPAIDLMVDALRFLALDKLTADKTQSALVTLAGADANVVSTIGLVVQRLTNPATNPGLAVLDAQTAKDVQQLGEQFAYDLAELAPGDKTTEAAALIDGI